jgi:hypothetical protein
MYSTVKSFRETGVERSIAGLDPDALVVFRTQPRRADSGHDREKLLEGHLKIEKAALTENPAVIVEDFIGDHQRHARETGDNRESARCVEMRKTFVSRYDSVQHDTGLAQGDNIALEAATKHRCRRS